MKSEARDRIIVVLIRARNPSNIGAVARAMYDFGFSRLRIVNDYPVPFAAARSAVDASAVLADATEHNSVADAVADCTLILGTTAVGERALEHPVYTLEQSLQRIADSLEVNGRVALLFGSEKTGLSNDELSHCHALLSIPMSTHEGERHLSMNLGQAAAVCLYRLATSSEHQPAPREDLTAPAQDLERVHRLLSDAMEISGYARRHPANAREAAVRRMVYRMALSSEDAKVWMGILRQFLHRNGKPD